jgi:hypothetical protein
MTAKHGILSAKTHNVLAGFAVLLVAAIFTFTGCSDDPGGGGGLDPLDPLDEAATGRATIEYTAVSVSGLRGNYAKFTNLGAGYEFSVTDGKMTLTLTTPTALQEVTEANLERIEGFGSTKPINIDSGGSVNFAVNRNFAHGNGDSRFQVERVSEDTDETTYYNASHIIYIYVSADVGISQTTFEETETDDEGTAHQVTYNTISLSLKQGWNLVQVDQHMTLTTGAYTMKIADKGVPWTVDSRSETGPAPDAEGPGADS